MIERHEYEGARPGPKLLIFGAIHGDEHCGPVAIRWAMERIETGDWPLRAGSVSFIPVCNPKAHEEKKRVRKENLNRIFRKTDDPQSEEAKLANELCAAVDGCDALLDIHSSFVPAPTNVFVDYPTAENLAFANALRPDFLVLDWPKVYENNAFDFDSWTTDRYAHEAGKTGILAECGQHDAASSLENAKRYIRRSLAHFGIIDSDEKEEEAASRRVRMTRIFRRESEEDSFARAWTHLEPVPRGTRIATRASGEELVAEHDCFILFPKDYALPGGEWFYLGTEDDAGAILPA